MECCLAASHNANIIVFNLFTLEGWFIANHLSIPCVAASPFLLNRFQLKQILLFIASVSRAPPDRFYKELQAVQSEIFNSLKHASPGM